MTFIPTEQSSLGAQQYDKRDHFFLYVKTINKCRVGTVDSMLGK